MPLSKPSPADLDLFSHGETDGFSVPQKQLAIDQAAALLWLATGVTEDPTDPTVLQIVKWAMLDMAWSLLVKTSNKTEIYSPFSSERIGSYSYAKANKQITSGEETGVEWFDAAVSLLNNMDPAAGQGAAWSTSEHVFPQGYEEQRLLEDFPKTDFWGF